jgi:hypothetical protein
MEGREIWRVVHRFSWCVERLLRRIDAPRFGHSDLIYRAMLELKRSLCNLEASLIDIIMERAQGGENRRELTEEEQRLASASVGLMIAISIPVKMSKRSSLCPPQGPTLELIGPAFARRVCRGANRLWNA